MKSESDITRYLCATAYLDYAFRDKVIQGILNEEHRAIGISYGVDVPMVIKHCLAARRRVFVRDSLAISASLVGAFVIAPLVAFLTEDDFLAVVVWMLSFASSVTCVVWEAVTRHKIIASHFLKDNYAAEYENLNVSAETARALERVSEQQKANVIVYSGFSPFVGSGIDLGGWSFSLNLNKRKQNLGESHEPQFFEVRELYGCLESELKKLDFEGLITEDRLFINGKDIREDPRFLSDPLSSPKTIAGPDLINEFKENPTHGVRHYMCVRITDWKGELALSVFLRLAKNGATFFTEVNYSLLTPIAERYRQVDLGSLGAIETLRRLGVAFVKGALIWSFAGWFLVFKVGHFLYRLRERNRSERLVTEDPAFDHGASGSLREYVSSLQYRRYFQKLDKEMYLKTVERLILDCITEFLEVKGVDTSELRARQATILNNGVIVTGGAVTTQNLAVGQSATASHWSETLGLQRST